MKDIAAALVKAQKSFGPALKSSENSHFRNRYAALDACIAAVMQPLNDAGIFLTQPTHETPDGVMVETVFMHESGETYSAGKLFVPAVKKDAQGFGSALTYARRYSLMAACGIAPEDDDGNAASKASQEQETNIAAILQAIAGAPTVESLKAHFDSAMLMAPSQYQDQIKQAKNIRYREIKSAEEAAQAQQGAEA